MITPSLPASSFAEVLLLVQKLAPHIPMFQVDIVDGVFAPSRSWPFVDTNTDPTDELSRLRELVALVPVEVDCMVEDPLQYLDVCAKSGVRSVIIHVGSTEAYSDCIMHARLHGYRIGLALTNDVPTEALTPFIHDIDFVQVMGIREVGKQGQPFDERTLTTLATLHAQHPKLELVVDGAVHLDTIVRLRDAGATRFAPGSFIAQSRDPVASYKQLSVLLAG
jgi:pentose-5-phosphate-3-epimerase